jgi:hypothetical protein
MRKENSAGNLLFPWMMKLCTRRDSLRQGRLTLFMRRQPLLWVGLQNITCGNHGKLYSKHSELLCNFEARAQNCEKRLLASLCLSVLPCVRMEQLGSQCRDFHDILYLNIFPKYVEKIQVSLKFENTNRHFT